MTRKDTLTRKGFDNLLRWFSEDRDQAALKYERIRAALIKTFSWAPCSDPESLADEAFNIVAAKLPDLAENYAGDPERYFYGVARKLIHKHPPLYQMVEITEDLKDDHHEDAEAEKTITADCKEKCLNVLNPEKKALIIDYYRNGSSQNPEFRKDMADRYQMDPGKLRVDIHRIRKNLSECFDKCFNQSRSVIT